MSGVKWPTREDVAHLREGMEVTVRMAGFDGVVTPPVSGALRRAVNGNLELGLTVIRLSDGAPSGLLAEVISPKPPPKPAHPVGTRVCAPNGAEYVKTDAPGEFCWTAYRYRLTSKTCVTDADVEGWEVIRDVPEVPDDVIEAVAQELGEVVVASERGKEGLMTDMANALARRGLLVGSVPENVIPDGHVAVDLRDTPSPALRLWHSLGITPWPQVCQAELKRRGEGL